MTLKRNKNRSSSSRSVEHSKAGGKAQPNRRGSGCQNQGSRRAVQCSSKDKNNLEAEQYPAFIPSQTFEQRKFYSSRKNSLNPMDAHRRSNETKQNKVVGGPCRERDNMSERPACSTDINKYVTNRVTRSASYAAVAQSANKVSRREQPTTQLMDAGDNASINGNFKQHKSSMKNVMSPDDTYARVCSLGQSNGKLVHSTPKTKKNSAGNMPTTENPIEEEEEGWNPLFYEPVLLLCPKMDNVGISSEFENDGSKATLCQQLRNWLAMGQANYMQKQRALELAKQEAAEKAEKLRQQQQQQSQGQQQQSQLQSQLGSEQQQQPQQQTQTYAQLQQQQQQQQQQTNNNNMNQNPRSEQKVHLSDSSYLYAPIAASIAETRTTWSTKTSSWGMQKPVSYEKPQRLQSSIRKKEYTNSNFGSMNGSVPTLTPTAFAHAPLWSVNSSNPFWVRDQLPAGTNVQNGDPYGLNSLPPKPKKKESTELVDAIKAGVGLLGPTPFEIYYTKLRAGRPMTCEFDVPKENTATVNQAKYMPRMVVEAGGSNEVDGYITPQLQPIRCPHNPEDFNGNGYSSEGYHSAITNSGAMNFVPNESSFQKLTLGNSYADLRPSFQANEQPTRSVSMDNNRSNWRKSSSKRSNTTGNARVGVKVGKRIKCNIDINSLETNAKNEVSPKQSMGTISVEVLMHEPNTIESTLPKPTDSDSDEFYSGVAEEEDIDCGDDSFKSCLQYPCDCSDGWNDTKSKSSSEDDMHKRQSGASSSSSSLPFVTPSELEFNNNNNNVPAISTSLRKPVKNPFNKKTGSNPCKKNRKERFYTQVKVLSIGNSNFDLEAACVKLRDFNIYRKPRGLSAMERINGFEYTVEYINEFLNYHSRHSLRGIRSFNNNNNSPVNGRSYHQNARNRKPSIRGRGHIQNRYGNDDNSDGGVRRNVPRFNPHWKSSKMRVMRQQQQQQQRWQQQQRRQQPVQQQQTLTRFHYQRTTVFTNSYHRHYHTKRVWKRPWPIKSIMLHTPQLLLQQQKLRQKQRQPKGPTNSSVPYDLVSSSETNIRPTLLENNSSTEEDDTVNTVNQENVQIDSEDSIQNANKKPHP